MFNIINITTNQLVNDENGKPLEFSDGKSAQAHINTLVDRMGGGRYRPAKVVEGDVNWKLREQNRFKTGEYKPVKILEQMNLVVPDHFVHQSNDSPTMLAYTKSEEKGRENIQTKVSLVGYLETYFKHLSEKDIANIKKQHDQIVYKDIVHFACTADEIEQVYTKYSRMHDDVSDSCMRYKARTFDGNIQPVRVYGAGDLAVAYLKNAKGETTARTLCWPEKKVYSRLYGSSELHEYMKALGYSKSSYYDRSDASAFVGARLLKIVPNLKRRLKQYNTGLKQLSYMVMPYIDENVMINYNPDKEYMEIVEKGDMNAHEAGGVAVYNVSVSCFKCGTKTKQSECEPVYVDSQGTQKLWCSTCRARKTFVCEGIHQLFDDSLTRYSFTTSYRPYYTNHFVQNITYTFSEYYLLNKGSKRYAICQFDKTIVYERKKAVSVVVDKHATVELWSPESAKAHAWRSKATKKYYSKAIHSIDEVQESALATA